MNTQTLIFVLVLLALGILAGLVWLAVTGSIIAGVILGAILAVVFVAIGLSFGLIHEKITSDRQQQQFMDNAQENLSIMGALQKIQNQQNQTLMQQLGTVSRLPQPPTPNGNFLIEDGIFDELE